jgi:L-ascorbate metabolism protein UlaG (beta-lactamase superfamily)
VKHTFAAAVAAAAIAVAPLPAFADEMIAADKGDITIHPFHHASVMLDWNGVSLLVDPAPPQGGTPPADPAAEYKAAGTPDIILVTHEHPDHFNPEILQAVAGDDTVLIAPQDVVDKLPDALKPKAKVMANGDTMEVDGIAIAAVPAYNTTPDRTKFHPKGRDNGYVLTLGGKKVYIAGDTEDTPEMRALTGIDVAFLPMNLPYTMDIDHAADAVKAFKPAIVIPYHYGQSDVNAFKTMVGDAADVRLLKWY